MPNKLPLALVPEVFDTPMKLYNRSIQFNVRCFNVFVVALLINPLFGVVLCRFVMFYDMSGFVAYFSFVLINSLGIVVLK